MTENEEVWCTCLHPHLRPFLRMPSRQGLEALLLSWLVGTCLLITTLTEILLSLASCPSAETSLLSCQGVLFWRTPVATGLPHSRAGEGVCVITFAPPICPTITTEEMLGKYLLKNGLKNRLPAPCVSPYTHPRPCPRPQARM